jgi:flavin reductase (DIM6/NTAB) family NADH-FMN oxidoreductase RutF
MDNTEILKNITNGYFIVTALKKAEEMETRDEDYLAAATVNWVTQISFEPEQIAVSVALFSDLNETIDKSGGFTLHVLSDKQMSWIEEFAHKSEITEEAINGVPYQKVNGEIILENSLTTITCKLSDSVRTGDHTLHIGEVTSAKSHKKLAPLSTVAVPSTYSVEHLPKEPVQ